MNNIITKIPDIKAKSEKNNYEKFYNEWNSTFDYINKFNKNLTNGEINKLISKLISFCKIPEELISLYNPFILLNNLTKNQLLKYNIIEKIVKNTVQFNNKDLIWFDNLVKKGYVINQETFELLFVNGYGSYYDVLQNMTIITQTQFIILSYIQDIDSKCLYEIMSKFKNLKLRELFIKSTNYKTCVDIINQFYNNEPHMIIDILSNVYDVISFIDITFIDEIINNGLFFNMNQLITNITHSNESPIKYDMLYNNSIYIHDLFQNKKISSVTYLSNLMVPTIYNDEKQNTYQINLHNPQVTLDDYIYLVDKFLLNPYNSRSDLINILEKTCEKSDLYTFNKIISMINYSSEKCLLLACSSSSEYIILKLLNMKTYPTIECLKVMQNDELSLTIYKKKRVLKILLDNGLPVNDETINVAFWMNLYIENLIQYNYTPDEKLYRLCLDNLKFPVTYVVQLNKYMDKKKFTEEELLYLDTSKNSYTTYHI